MRLAIIFIFLLAGLFGATILMNNMDANMPNCPLMNESASLCQMNLLEHISQWQSTFILTVIGLLIFVLVVFLFGKVKQKSLDFLDFYKRKSFSYQLFNNLLLVFYRGLLHPKIF